MVSVQYTSICCYSTCLIINGEKKERKCHKPLVLFGRLLKDRWKRTRASKLAGAFRAQAKFSHDVDDDDNDGDDEFWYRRLHDPEYICCSAARKKMKRQTER